MEKTEIILAEVLDELRISKRGIDYMWIIMDYTQLKSTKMAFY